jgi:hypothetical protein
MMLSRLLLAVSLGSNLVVNGGSEMFRTGKIGSAFAQIVQRTEADDRGNTGNDT